VRCLFLAPRDPLCAGARPGHERGLDPYGHQARKISGGCGKRRVWHDWVGMPRVGSARSKPPAQQEVIAGRRLPWRRETTGRMKRSGDPAAISSLGHVLKCDGPTPLPRPPIRWSGCTANRAETVPPNEQSWAFRGRLRQSDEASAKTARSAIRQPPVSRPIRRCLAGGKSYGRIEHSWMPLMTYGSAADPGRSFTAGSARSTTRALP